jgi:hypothetical protein
VEGPEGPTNPGFPPDISEFLTLFKTALAYETGQLNEHQRSLIHLGLSGKLPRGYYRASAGRPRNLLL